MDDKTGGEIDRFLRGLRDPLVWVPIFAAGVIVGLVVGSLVGGAGKDRSTSVALAPSTSTTTTSSTTTTTIPLIELEVSTPDSEQAMVQTPETDFVGMTEPGASVKIGDNEVTADSAGSFSYKFPLSEGSQSVDVTASAEGFEAVTRTYVLTYELPQLDVDISAPVAGQEIESPEVNVRGTTQPGANVGAWGVSGTAGSDGAFSLMVPAPKGNHSLTAKVTKEGWDPGQDTVKFSRVAPAPPPEPEMTIGQRQGVSKARQYLDYSSFSRSGLITQLVFEGFTKADATFAVDRMSPDWNEQAADKAQQYLDYSSFSRSGLITQLVFEGFSKAQAEYGVKAVGY